MPVPQVLHDDVVEMLRSIRPSPGERREDDFGDAIRSIRPFPPCLNETHKGAGGYKYHKGVKGREAGPAMKDDPKGWPDPTPHWGTSLNRAAKFNVVKTHVVKKGLD